MNNIFLKKKAFTLAEVLITLVIIGIVAAMTLPLLISKIGQDALNTAFKKEFSVLSQATQNIMRENGGTLKGAFKSLDDVQTLYSSNLSYTKSCPISTYTSNLCWHDRNGWYDRQDSKCGTAGDCGSSLTSTKETGLILKDGSFVVFQDFSPDCTLLHMSEFNPQLSCTIAYIDVNGLKKPNTMGSDIFLLWVVDNLGVVPVGKSGWMFSKGYSYYNMYPGIDRAAKILYGEN